jgi:threonine dehydrogenase-like Zn-dependent dehydrogenase
MHDVLILGAELAGQRAALAAAETGASVVLVSKVHPVRSHSVAAAGGINASVGEGDTWEAHAQDTTKGPDYLGDQDAIEVMCREAPGEIVHMERLGVRRRLAAAHLLRRRHHRPGAASPCYSAVERPSSPLALGMMRLGFCFSDLLASVTRRGRHARPGGYVGWPSRTPASQGLPRPVAASMALRLP